MIKNAKARPKNGYFAAANTGRGFLSYYEKIFDIRELDRLVIIKGGSGTGKSSFLRKLANAAEGCGYPVEYFLCSSDPSSLDGVLFRGSDGRLCGALDGTAPHLRDTELPGACDMIYDLGQFWDTKALRAEREHITELCKKKSALFTSAYRELAAALEQETAAALITEKYLDTDKMEAAAERAAKLLSSGSGSELLRPTDSFGMDGRIRLDTLASKAERTYRVVGAGADKYLSCLRKSALSRGACTVVSPSLLCPHEPCALYFPDSGICFSSEEKGFAQSGSSEHDGKVNMERFLRITDKADRTAVRRAIKLRDEAFSLAEVFFSGIKNAHRELEVIYGKAMDFGRKDEAEERLVGELIR